MARRFVPETFYCGGCLSHRPHSVRDSGPFTLRRYRCLTCGKRTNSDERRGLHPIERGKAEEFQRYLERRTADA